MNRRTFLALCGSIGLTPSIVLPRFELEIPEDIRIGPNLFASSRRVVGPARIVGVDVWPVDAMTDAVVKGSLVRDGAELPIIAWTQSTRNRFTWGVHSDLLAIIVMPGSSVELRLDSWPQDTIAWISYRRA